MIKASFVVPAKNAEKYVVGSIDSMLKQTEKDIEVIFVNDHSTDKTLEIVQSIARKAENLKIINLNEKKGVAAARNEGTRQAQGEIILPADADDPNLSIRAEICIKELKQSQADIFYGNLLRYYAKTGKKEKRHFQPYDGKLLKYINYIPHPGASAYYKYVFEKLGGYDEGIEIGEDYDFWLRAQEKGLKFFSKNIVLALYSMHSGQVTDKSDLEKIRRRQEWIRLVRKKHGIYHIDLEYIKQHISKDAEEFYLKKNFEIWFDKNSIPKRS